MTRDEILDWMIKYMEGKMQFIAQGMQMPGVPPSFVADHATALCALYDEQRKRRVQDALVELSKHADMPPEIAEILVKLL